MDVDVFLDYQLTGVGYSDATFSIGAARLELEQLGDSPDPIEELMSAALALAYGTELPPQLLWDPEDGTTYRWDFVRRGERVRIRVAHADASTPWGRDGGVGAAPVVFDAECCVATFCRVVTDCAAGLLDRYGPDEYAELTFGPFPFVLFAQLRAAIG